VVVRKDTMETLAPFALGHYVAETDLLAHPSRAMRSFAPAAWKRLTSQRQRLDPQGLFHSFLTAR
jgi:FAD/FMN-containing dehydrogenase